MPSLAQKKEKKESSNTMINNLGLVCLIIKAGVVRSLEVGEGESGSYILRGKERMEVALPVEYG